MNKKERVKRIKEKAKFILEKENLSLNENNQIVLPLHLVNLKNIYSPFCYNFNLLNDDIYNYLETFESIHIAPNQLIIEVHVDEQFSLEESNNFKEALHNRYEKELLAKSIAIKKKMISSLILLGLGVLVLALMIILDYTIFRNSEHGIWLEVIDIIAWVLIWEAVDLALFGKAMDQRRIERCKKFQNAEILFIKEDEKI